MLEPRAYQDEAANDLISFFYQHQEGHPCLLAPTAAGKSLIQAEFIKRLLSQWGGLRIACVTHVKELVEQNHEKFVDQAPHLDAGIYSASVGRRDTQNQVIFMGIQSVYNKAESFGAFDLVIVDEAHLIPVKGEGMYRQFFNECKAINNKLRVVGLTATPYRLDSGALVGGKDSLFTHLIESESMTVDALLDGGYLCPLTTEPVQTRLRDSIEGVAKRGCDFVAGQLQTAVNVPVLVKQAVGELVELGQNRNCWLIFAAGGEHAEEIKIVLDSHGIKCGIVTQKTTKKQRELLIKQHKSGEILALINVRVLTTGYDNPRIDFIGDFAPTDSIVLYVQKMGRGFRVHPSKSDCLIADFAGNIETHGAVNKIKPPPPKKASNGEGDPLVKDCDKCGALIYIQTRVCPQCGFELIDAQGNPTHNASASTLDIIAKANKRLKVNLMTFKRHHKKGASDSVRVDYFNSMRRVASEWLCFDHDGRARRRAVEWFCENVEQMTQDNFRMYYSEMASPKDNGALTVDNFLEFATEGFSEFVLIDFLVVDNRGKYPEIRQRGQEL